MFAFYVGAVVFVAVGGRRKKLRVFEAAPIMIRQIYSDYHLPMMPQEMSWSEIRFWYEPLIPQLIELQKMAKNRKK